MVAGALALTAACGGTSGDMVPVPQAPLTLQALQADAAGFADDVTRLGALSPTTPRNVPTAGASVFRGPAALSVIRDGSPIVMVGDSALRIDFGTSRTTGRISSFRGSEGEGDRLFRAKGDIIYSGGEIGRGAEAGAFAANIAGDLDTGRDRISVDGYVIGEFVGNRTTGAIRPKGVIASGLTDGIDDQAGGTLDPTMTATLNGRPATVIMQITGEN